MDTFFNNLIIALYTNDINFIKNNSKMIGDMFSSDYVVEKPIYSHTTT